MPDFEPEARSPGQDDGVRIHRANQEHPPSLVKRSGLVLVGTCLGSRPFNFHPEVTPSPKSASWTKPQRRP